MIYAICLFLNNFYFDQHLRLKNYLKIKNSVNDQNSVESIMIHSELHEKYDRTQRTIENRPMSYLYS